MTVQELEALWSSLPVPAAPGGISGRRAQGLPVDRPVYLAVDGRNHRHLLVQVPDDTRPVTHRETRGLQVSTERFQVGTNPEALYVDLACLDSSQHPTFSAVVQDLLRTLTGSSTPLRDTVIDALARWRAFWSIRSARLSREEALGLFGELWFLRRWLAPVDAAVLSTWQATPGARHDFQWPEASVEVKTASGRSGQLVHRITGLEQLEDPQQGQLYLFSLRVCDDALALNTLPGLVEGLVEQLHPDPTALMRLNQKLAARGYNPADAQAYMRPLRVLEERLYHVTDGFPRLTRASLAGDLPDGVVDVSYSLGIAACSRWLVAQSPTEGRLPPLCGGSDSSMDERREDSTAGSDKAWDAEPDSPSDEL